MKATIFSLKPKVIYHGTAEEDEKEEQDEEVRRPCGQTKLEISVVLVQASLLRPGFV